MYRTRKPVLLWASATKTGPYKRIEENRVAAQGAKLGDSVRNFNNKLWYNLTVHFTEMPENIGN